ncbi:hypothetical protein INR49_008550 [Caranx melampygus]|nr:hypothetical protein INR49_008550 [Caranx melampygus]
MATADSSASPAPLNTERQPCDGVVSQPYVLQVMVWLVECHRIKGIVRQVQLIDRVLDVLWHQGKARGRTVQQGGSLTGAGLWTDRRGQRAVDPSGDEEQHSSQYDITVVFSSLES